jgi:hypothetical protein
METSTDTLCNSAFLGPAAIRTEYRWSDSMIQRYLGEPDAIEERRGQYCPYKIHLFLRARVVSAEATPGFVPRRVRHHPARIKTSAPRSITCWRCGEKGHGRRECELA